MQISILGGGVDTVSDHHPQVPEFESRGMPYSSLSFSNSIGHDLHDVILRFRKFPSGYASSQRVTQVQNGLRNP